MKTRQIFLSPLFFIAVIELWLAFIVYDYAISDELNFLTSLGLSCGFVFLNHKTGQGFFGPNLSFAPLRVLAVILVISAGGYLFDWHPVELFFRLVTAYFATVQLQKFREKAVLLFTSQNALEFEMSDK